jgi:hypothetical protein
MILSFVAQHMWKYYFFQECMETLNIVLILLNKENFNISPNS